MSGAEPPAKNARSDFAEWNNYAEDVIVNDSVDDDVDRYVTQRQIVMANEKDLLGWWRANSTVYSRLSQLARYMLCVPASSSSSERVFSAAGQTTEERRTRPSLDIVDALLFLHSAL